MPISFYSALAGVITKYTLTSSKGCFTNDYPEERKKFVVDVCACVAMGLVTKLLPMII